MTGVFYWWVWWCDGGCFLQVTLVVGVMVLTPRVHGHAGDPLAVGLQLLAKLLLEQVVDADAALSGHQEVGPQRVEAHTLHRTTTPAEWVLAPPPRQLVHQHLQVAAVVRHHRRQVVTLGVPRHLLDSLGRAGERGPVSACVCACASKRLCLNSVCVLGSSNLWPLTLSHCGVCPNLPNIEADQKICPDNVNSFLADFHYASLVDLAFIPQCCVYCFFFCFLH